MTCGGQGFWRPTATGDEGPELGRADRKNSKKKAQVQGLVITIVTVTMLQSRPGYVALRGVFWVAFGAFIIWNIKALKFLLHRNFYSVYGYEGLPQAVYLRQLKGHRRWSAHMLVHRVVACGLSCFYGPKLSLEHQREVDLQEPGRLPTCHAVFVRPKASLRARGKASRMEPADQSAKGCS